MNIPCKMRPVGGGLPLGYTRLEYLESTGTQYIELPFFAQDTLGAEVEYIDFFANNDVSIMSCLHSDLHNDRFYLPYTHNGNVYLGWKTWDIIGYSSNANILSYSKLNYTNDRKWSFVFGDKSYSGTLNGELPTDFNLKLLLFAYKGPNNLTPLRFLNGRLFFANISLGNKIVMKLIPCLDPNNRPCMFDTVSKKPFYNAATTGPDFLYG